MNTLNNTGGHHWWQAPKQTLCHWLWPSGICCSAGVDGGDEIKLSASCHKQNHVYHCQSARKLKGKKYSDTIFKNKKSLAAHPRYLRLDNTTESSITVDSADPQKTGSSSSMKILLECFAKNSCAWHLPFFVNGTMSPMSHSCLWLFETMQVLSSWIAMKCTDYLFHKTILTYTEIVKGASVYLRD